MLELEYRPNFGGEIKTKNLSAVWPGADDYEVISMHSVRTQAPTVLQEKSHGSVKLGPPRWEPAVMCFDPDYMKRTRRPFPPSISCEKRKCVVCSHKKKLLLPTLLSSRSAEFIGGKSCTSVPATCVIGFIETRKSNQPLTRTVEGRQKVIDCCIQRMKVASMRCAQETRKGTSTASSSGKEGACGRERKPITSLLEGFPVFEHLICPLEIRCKAQKTCTSTTIKTLRVQQCVHVLLLLLRQGPVPAQSRTEMVRI